MNILDYQVSSSQFCKMTQCISIQVDRMNKTWTRYIGLIRETKSQICRLFDIFSYINKYCLPYSSMFDKFSRMNLNKDVLTRGGNKAKYNEASINSTFWRN